MGNLDMYQDLRFKGFDDEWKERKISEVSTTFSGGTPSVNNHEYYGGNIPFIRSAEISSNTTELKLTQSGYNDSSAKMVKVGDILYALYGATSGEVAISKINGAINQAVLLIRTLDDYDSNFIMQWLRNNKIKITSKYLQGGQGNLSGKIIKDLLIYLPVIEEQQKIGQFFKKLDELITLNQNKLDKLKDLKKGYLQKVFPVPGKSIPELRFKGFYDDWESHTFEDLASVAMNKRVFKNQTSDVGDIPFYKIGTFGSKPDSFITKELFNEYKNKYPYPKVGDILISASGSIGKTVEYQGKDEYFQDSNIVWLKHDNRLDNLFLKQFYLVVKWKGLEGSTIKRLYNKSILSTNISIPTTVEQQKIGQFFKKLDELIDNQSKKIDQLKELKKGYLQKMFV